jgi:hypothetical protein
MKKKICMGLALVLFQTILGGAAQAQLTSPANGGNKRASVSEQIGITDVSIRYDRPGVKGRDGHIWGGLVPIGYVDQGFGTSKAAPWRAGANENTTIEFSTDVKIEGQALPAGKYAFFIAYDPEGSTLIFSKNNTSWGSFFYNPAEDVLRVKVKPVKTDQSVEWLKYEFTNQTPSSAMVTLEWEKLAIPFKVDVDFVATQLASFRKELRGERGFTWDGWNQAALFCAQNKTNLEEGLTWANNAVGPDFGGSHSFQAWATKAAVLDSLGRDAEAQAAIKTAIPFGDINELYFYARGLAAHKKGKEAFDIFKANYDKYPTEFLTNAGMVRAYSAIGDYKKALALAQKTRTMAKDKPNQDTMDRMIAKLQSGKDVN